MSIQLPSRKNSQNQLHITARFK